MHILHKAQIHPQHTGLFYYPKSFADVLWNKDIFEQLVTKSNSSFVLYTLKMPVDLQLVWPSPPRLPCPVPGRFLPPPPAPGS
jgi:hypothetical protein